jgi:ankyrin repeat protein
MSSTNVDAFVQFAADGLFERVKQCLDAGNVHIDGINKDGWTALMCAAEKGHEGVCDLLITRGCKADMQSNNGWTALMCAAQNGRIPIMISLIEAGCNHSLRNKEGKSALDFVKEKHSDKVKEVQVTQYLTHSYLLTHLLTHSLTYLLTRSLT